MEKKRECVIVQDLLPNYIEKLTNEETNNYIEEHLENCKECSEILENMKKELRLSINKYYKTETDYIKKFRKRQNLLRRSLLFIILVILIVWGNIVGERMRLLISLQNTGIEAKQNREMKLEEDNEYIKIQSSSIYESSEIEAYKKDGNFLITINNYNRQDENETHIYYKKGEEELHLVDNGTTKYMEKKANTSANPVYYTGNTFIENLWIAITNNIGHDQNRKFWQEYYTVKNGDTTWTIHERTGLVYSINTTSSQTNYTYEFGIVKDSDIVRPDTTGYVEKEDIMSN